MSSSDSWLWGRFADLQRNCIVDNGAWLFSSKSTVSIFPLPQQNDNVELILYRRFGGSADLMGTKLWDLWELSHTWQLVAAWFWLVIVYDGDGDALCGNDSSPDRKSWISIIYNNVYIYTWLLTNLILVAENIIHTGMIIVYVSFSSLFAHETFFSQFWIRLITEAIVCAPSPCTHRQLRDTSLQESIIADKTPLDQQTCSHAVGLVKLIWNQDQLT